MLAVAAGALLLAAGSGIGTLPAGLPGAQAQELDWATAAGGPGVDRGHGVAVDGAGNAVVTGEFAGTATFGEGPDRVMLTAASPADIFVAKYAPDGRLLWATKASGSTGVGNVGHGVAVDGAGNALVTGAFSGTATFGEGPDRVMLTPLSTRNIFVAKYAPDGRPLWATRGPGAGGVSRGNGVAVDRAGNALVTGFTDSSTIMFVAKFDPDGRRLWVTTAGDGGGNGGPGQDVAVDGAGNALVTGFFQGTVTLGTGGENATTLTAASEQDVFLAKYDPDGHLLWATRAGGPAVDQGHGVAVDGAGNALVTGRFTGTATFGEGPDQVTLTAAGLGWGIFLAKYAPGGRLLWATQAGGGGSASRDQGHGVAVDGAGDVLVTGEFSGTATFGEGPDRLTLTAAGERDIFVAKWLAEVEEHRPTAVAVPFDIRPQGCRNPLNTKARGVLPAAILGTAEFAVAEIDPDTVRLAGVAPLRFSYEDVATPFEPFLGKADPFDCTTAGPDGFTDLTLKFDNRAIAGAIGPVERGKVLILEVTGELHDGTPIVGEDVVVVVQ